MDHRDANRDKHRHGSGLSFILVDHISEMTKSAAFGVGGLFLMASLLVVALNHQALIVFWVLAIMLGTIA
jgi:hypothetical protein